MGSIHRLGIAAGVVVALAMAMPVSAASNGTVVSTYNFHGVESSFQTNPCNGDALSGTETTNGVLHSDTYPSGEVRVTSTWEASFSLTDTTIGSSSLGVTYAGRYTYHVGGIYVGGPLSGTTSVQATGSDGSTLTFHQDLRLTLLPDGTISVAFDKVHLTCG